MTCPPRLRTTPCCCGWFQMAQRTEIQNLISCGEYTCWTDEGAGKVTARGSTHANRCRRVVSTCSILRKASQFRHSPGKKYELSTRWRINAPAPQCSHAAVLNTARKAERHERVIDRR